MELSHEYVAAPLTTQIKALTDVVRATNDLISSIEKADTQANGLAVSYQVGDAWASFFDREAQFERNLAIMASDMTKAMSEENAWSLLHGWQAAGRIERPQPIDDLRMHLQEFVSAAVLARDALQKGNAPSRTKGDAFQEFVAALFSWRDEHRITAGVSKASSNCGRLTQLVKAILGEVPVIYDSQGQKAPKQIRRPTVADTSLAEAIGDAAKAFEEKRPGNAK
tara:strand:+ start:186 stop:857 length:672 start_codon:yes stop_codon:yes gene_type:complete